MARSGLYKSDIKKARDSLIALGTNPSVDAVRIALGNTGSKTTIHKYLKELEEEGGQDHRKTSISESLQDLVARLATQLQDEADAQIYVIRTQQVEHARLQNEAQAALQKEIDSAHEQLQRAESSLLAEQTAHGQTREMLQREAIARNTADQQISDLKERLSENKLHRQSLEEKHQHAREALEHYRQSIKEQRDQDQRRHEQQLQQLQAELRQAQQSIIVKQEEVTRLNQDGVRLIAELTHVRQALHKEEETSRRQVQDLEKLQLVQQRNNILTAQLGEKEEREVKLQTQLANATARLEELSTHVRELELTNAASLAKISAQQEIAAELRNYLDTKKQSVTT